MSPLYKARTCPRTPKCIAIRVDFRQSSEHELAAWAGTLAFRARVVHGDGGNL